MLFGLLELSDESDDVETAAFFTVLTAGAGWLSSFGFGLQKLLRFFLFLIRAAAAACSALMRFCSFSVSAFWFASCDAFFRSEIAEAAFSDRFSLRRKACLSDQAVCSGLLHRLEFRKIILNFFSFTLSSASASSSFALSCSCCLIRSLSASTIEDTAVAREMKSPKLVAPKSTSMYPENRRFPVKNERVFQDFIAFFNTRFCFFDFFFQISDLLFRFSFSAFYLRFYCLYPTL